MQEGREKMTQNPQPKGSIDDLPKASIRKNRKTWFFWIIPIAAAILAGYFVYNESIKKGPTITILFKDAGGLQPGKSFLKYRGVEIGTVNDVALTDDHRHVKVIVDLKKSGSSVAKTGSLFWIVQPHVGLNEIKGLGTVVSGDYISVEPGDGKDATVFRGLPEAPPSPGEEEGLSVVLIASRLGSVKKHVPVKYRGIEVGEVSDTQLGPDAQVIHIKVNIKRHFAPLVRMNSVFWNAGGINFNLGLSGIDVSAQSAQALVTGRIDFATPDTSKPQAEPDTPFILHDKPQDAWKTWSPRIKLPPETIDQPSDEKSTGGGLKK